MTSTLPSPSAGHGPIVICQECGMPCAATEFHPMAACLMFKGCHDSDKVRANLAALTSASKQEGGEPDAWMTSDGRVLAAKTKANAAAGAERSAMAGYTIPLYAAPQPPLAGAGEALDRQALIDWAAGCWHAEVAKRPLVNVHRRSLDDTWRQVLRHLGVDDRARLGPTHDELLSAKPAPLNGGCGDGESE